MPRNLGGPLQRWNRPARGPRTAFPRGIREPFKASWSSYGSTTAPCKTNLALTCRLAHITLGSGMHSGRQPVEPSCVSSSFSALSVRHLPRRAATAFKTESGRRVMFSTSCGAISPSRSVGQFFKARHSRARVCGASVSRSAEAARPHKPALVQAVSLQSSQMHGAGLVQARGGVSSATFQRRPGGASSAS